MVAPYEYAICLAVPLSWQERGLCYRANALARRGVKRRPVRRAGRGRNSRRARESELTELILIPLIASDPIDCHRCSC